MNDSEGDEDGEAALDGAREETASDGSEEEACKYPPERLKIKQELVNFARSFLARWDEMAGRETKSNSLGFDFVGRQTDHDGMVVTVAKASVPGLTLDMHRKYRENVHNLTQLVDEKIRMDPVEDYDGCRCFIQQIKMPMFMTNRSIPVLYYCREFSRDKGVEFVSSSKGTAEVERINASLIGKNVIGNTVINYSRVTPTTDGCYWESVLCIDIGGSIPAALQRTSADTQMKS